MSDLNVAGMLPEEMSSGLPDDFDGVVSKCRLVPWDYEGKAEQYGWHLAAKLDITPDADSGIEPFAQYYSTGGSLENWAPSNDGKTALDTEEEDCEGVYALRVGQQQKLPGGSNWAHFLTALLETDFPRDKVTPDVSFLDGARCHFNRTAQRKRSGIVNEDEQGRGRQILIATDFYGYEDVKETKSTTTKATKAKATKSKTTDDLDDEIVTAVTEILAENDGSMPKAKIPKELISRFEGANRAKAVKRFNDSSFLSASFNFDADSGVISL